MDESKTVVALEPRWPDVMVDIETLGLTEKAVVYEIGMVAFDRVTGRVGDSILIHLSIDDQVKRGRTIEPRTIKWLFRNIASGQPVSAPLLPDSEEYEPSFGLNAMTWFAQGYVRDNASWWFNGCSFDSPILESLLGCYGINAPWKYYQERDVRTVLKMAGVKMRDQTHNAEEDAKNQVEHLCLALEVLRKGNW